MSDGRTLIDHRAEAGRRRLSLGLPAFLVLIFGSTVSAKGPTLEHLFPGGGQRGSTVEVTATGQFDRWPVRSWTSNPALVVTPGTEKGKLTVAIAADLTPGLYWIRLFDDEGPTHPRPFLVGTLNEVSEVEPNDEVARAQVIEASGVTINGRLGKSGDVDAFRVALKQGQTLVAALEAHRLLGSPMDGVLQITSADGFVLAQNDDDRERDPRIIFQAPRDGDYLVRAFAFPFVQESTIRFAGHPSYVYRLTLTTGGYVDHVVPLAVTLDCSGEVEPIGWNIAESARKLVVEATAEPAVGTLWHPSLANTVEVRRVAEPSLIEVEPNDRDRPQRIPCPVALTGRIDKPGDRDRFEFAARQGETLLLRVIAREFGSPIDAVLRVADSSGATLAEVDDSARAVDPEIRFKVPKDGQYQAQVHDLNGHGGPNHAYLLTIEPPRPDFRLTLKVDQFAITPGTLMDLAVQVERSEGYSEPIEIGLLGRYDGVIAEPVISARTGPTASSVTLKLKACDCVQPGPIQVVGRSAESRPRLATATLAGLSTPIDSAWLTPARPVVINPEPKEAPPPK